MDLNALRRFAPLAVFLVIVMLGWALLVRPITAERARAERQLAGLHQRETQLRREIGEASPRVAIADSVAAFERQVAVGDSAPALLEQLARLALNARVRNLLIETVEGGSATSVASAPRSAQPDPRFGLFDERVSYVPIRVAFDTDYAGLGRFLWAFRDLPTTTEVRTLTVSLPVVNGETVAVTDGTLRVSMSLYSYSRSGPSTVAVLR